MKSINLAFTFLIQFVLITSVISCSVNSGHQESFGDKFHAMTLSGVDIQWRLAKHISDDKWATIPLIKNGNTYSDKGKEVVFNLTPSSEGVLIYELEVKSSNPTRIGLFVKSASVSNDDYPFHVLPAVMFGDNNLEHVLAKERYPHLTRKFSEEKSCSPYWEFRSDRCAMPMSAMCYKNSTVAVSIDPYVDAVLEKDGKSTSVHTGVVASLGEQNADAECGVSIGYANWPIHYSHQQTVNYQPPSHQQVLSGKCSGRIYATVSGGDRRSLHKFIRNEYALRRELPKAIKSIDEAIAACSNVFRDVIWSEEDQVYCNLYWDGLSDQPQTFEVRRRLLEEIGWCGGPTLALPVMQAALKLKDSVSFSQAIKTCNQVTELFNPVSGMLYDYGMAGRKEVNGWWSGFEKDKHWSYNNGTCVSYLLNTADMLEVNGEVVPEAWDRTAEKVLNTVVKCQMDNGNLGYAYYLDKQAILDPDGFAGAYFIPGLVRAAKRFNNAKYLDAAKRAFVFYHGFIKSLDSWGASMDTGKANNEEGALGFIRAAKLLHEATGDQYYLEALGDGIDYECLWRYGYRAKPIAKPLSDGWNSCGGSVTSVANPCIHPMGVQVSEEIDYYAQKTGDEYVQKRYEDGILWAMQSLELYPEKTGFGPYGLTSERYCPSDGLLIETYPSGDPASIWFSCHAFGVASILEGLLYEAAQMQK